MWGDCNIYELLTHHIYKILRIPFFGGSPAASTFADNERKISCNIAHELEWTRLFSQLIDRP